ncbi:MAG: chalcone isomerase family protein [Syntrophales bacterium]|jgi:hypothetical protein|nr:chalcone isomerase family protein [Syntrophales bacterium]MCK9527997.1 chalcone isomerase family protein [Syntrophales bacterium]MDX9921426.1 chalcone isomerase family protein [Syntrophales bacterium]
MKKLVAGIIVAAMILCVAPAAFSADKEILGVPFPTQKIINDTQVYLNGLASRKALVVVNVFAGGFYLENPTNNAREAIESDQIKQFYLVYLTNKATAAKLQEGFIEAIEKANPAEMIAAQQTNIKKYASWLDKDMEPGLTSVATYIPGEGLTLEYQGEVKGTINDPDFIRMYFRYNLGEQADKKLRDGYLGL